MLLFPRLMDPDTHKLCWGVRPTHSGAPATGAVPMRLQPTLLGAGAQRIFALLLLFGVRVCTQNVNRHHAVASGASAID